MKRVFLCLLLVLCMSCSRPEEVKIGMITDFSSTMSWIGDVMQNAAEMAAEEINAGGGIKGYPLKMVYEDNQFDPAKAVTSANKLLNVDGVQAMYTLPSASGIVAINNVLSSHQVVQMTPGCFAKACQTEDDHLFRLAGPYDNEAKALIRYVVEDLGHKRWSVLYVNNDYGYSSSEVVKDEAWEYKGLVLSSEAYEARTTDFRTLLAKVKQEDPEVLIIFPFGEAGHIIKQAREIGLSVPIVGGVGVQNARTIEVAADAAEGVVYAYFDLSRARDSAFSSKYKERFGMEPDMWAVKTYDAIYVMAKALSSCENPMDSACLKPALEALPDFEGVYADISFNSYGEMPQERYELRVIKDGAFQSR